MYFFFIENLSSYVLLVAFSTQVNFFVFSQANLQHVNQFLRNFDIAMASSAGK